MKLDRNTKRGLKVGDVLRFSDSEQYEIIRIFHCINANINATNLTLKREGGGMIYYAPSSSFYGGEIIHRPFCNPN
jgi:hypothetical protein